MNQKTIDNYLCELLNPHKGFILIKGFLHQDQTERYRQECEQFLLIGKREYQKFNGKNSPDYVWPTTFLPNGQLRKNEAAFPDSAIYRIYQYLHNQHSPETEEIFRKTLIFRNQIEENWLHNDVYKRKREGLNDYIQASKYVRDSNGLRKHKDLKEELPYPLLQSLIFLSQPNVDYQGGELIIYTKMNGVVKVQANLGVEKGDALFFDKSLFHEVKPTYASEMSDIGRWTVIVGGRYSKPPTVPQQIKQSLRRSAYRAKKFIFSH